MQIEAAIIEHGELLEEYPDDPRGESCLVLGFVGKRPLHAVLGQVTMKGESRRMLRIITVYTPTGAEVDRSKNQGKQIMNRYAVARIAGEKWSNRQSNTE